MELLISHHTIIQNFIVPSDPLIKYFVLGEFCFVAVVLLLPYLPLDMSSGCVHFPTKTTNFTSFPELILLRTSSLFLPYSWWMRFSIVLNLILFNWEDIVIIELLQSFEPILVTHLILQNYWKCLLFPFPKISHCMHAWVFVVLPLTTRTTFVCNCQYICLCS